MKQYRTISDLKDHAKELLTGRFGGAVLANAIPPLLTYTFTFLFTMISTFVVTFQIMMNNPDALENAAATGSNIGLSVATYVFTQILAIFIGVFGTGIALYYLKIASGRPASVSDIFYGFKHTFKKSVTISAVGVLINAICLLPYNYFYFLYSAEGSTKLLLYAFISLCIGMVIYIPIALGISQSYFLLLDFPKYNAKEVILLSVRIMKGRKRKLFLIELGFVPLMLLSLLTFGLGDLWLTPYTNMTMALYFLDIMKPESAVKEM